jgi:hypothetical protein
MMKNAGLPLYRRFLADKTSKQVNVQCKKLSMAVKT